MILDTDKIIDEEYKKQKNIERSEFVKNYDWCLLVNKSDIINNSLSNLKSSKFDIKILSKISSLNEGIAKVNFLRDKDISCDIHLVPTKISKSDMVKHSGNILIDDKLYNLDEWVNKGGKAIFFNKNNEDIDINGKNNTKYPKISSLDILLQDRIDI